MIKRYKKILAAIVTASLALGICACSNAYRKEEKPTTPANNVSKDYDKIVYAYATTHTIDSDNLDIVEEAINAITKEKIGVEVELMPFDIVDYSSSVNLELQSGNKIDVFESLGNFNTFVSGGMSYDLTDILDQYATETQELLGKELLAACEKEGRLYGIPTYRPYALTPMVVYKQEITDELGIDMTKVKSIYDLTNVLRKVKEAHPVMTPLVPSCQGTSGVNLGIPEVDYLTDDLSCPNGVLLGNNMSVIDYYETDEFKNVSKLVRKWYLEDLILKDAATTTSTSDELMTSDNSFCYIAAYNNPPNDISTSLEAQCGGRPLGAVPIGDAYLDTSSVNDISWMVSSASKVPEAALKFLNLTFTDKDIINLLIYGIKDRDYRLDADGYASYTEGKEASVLPYAEQQYHGTLGNYFLMYPMVGTNKDSLIWEEEQNQKAKKSPAMGFIFDTSLVRTEYTEVSNVIQQYLPGLLCGSVDPDIVIPEFEDKLTSVGLDTIIAAKQEQLDSWLENK